MELSQPNKSGPARVAGRPGQGSAARSPGAVPGSPVTGASVSCMQRGTQGSDPRRPKSCRKGGLCLVHGNASQTQAGGGLAHTCSPPPAGPVLTLPGSLRVPQLSLEAHACELFGAGPLACAGGRSCAVLAIRGLPLGDPHGREGGGAPGSTPGDLPERRQRTAEALSF